MSYFTKTMLITIASITGLGFYKFSTLMGNEALLSYTISLIGAAGTGMALIEYHIHYQTCQKHHQDQNEASK